jgi:hypothetical protein
MLHDHTQTFHARYDSSGRVIRTKQRPLLNKTHTTHKRQTFMTPAGFEQTTQQASGRSPIPKPLGQWDRPSLQMLPLMSKHEVLTFSTRWHETESNDCQRRRWAIMDVSTCCGPGNERNLSAQKLWCGGSPRSVNS